MQLISRATEKSISGGSWIRRMFEAGIALKNQYGADNVCDFSLGNPDLPPPPEVAQAFLALAKEVDKPFSLGYMPNGGYTWARELMATHVSKEQGIAVSQNDVILSCGAAGALNAFFKATLNPGEEVLAIAPYFVEYGAYVGNHGGAFRTVRSQPDTFALDIAALDEAIGPKTRAVIINSPNNPTGQIYSQEEVIALTSLLAQKTARFGSPVFLVSDEPYRFLAYDGVQVPSVLALYPYSIVVSSFSKSLCIPGERTGYAAVSPLMEGRESLITGMVLANRVLGYVNPPVVGQHILKYAIETQVDPTIYCKRRNLMASILTEAGYDFFLPKGAFYFFPKAPGGDDIAFADKLMQEKILVVPGTGFGGPGHFRIAFCVGEEVITRAAAGLKRAIG